MDEVFGETASAGKAAEDQNRLSEIHRRLGLDKFAVGQPATDRKATSEAEDEKLSVEHAEKQ